MAPTVGSKNGGRSPVRNRRPGGSIERSGLICRVKYTNSLPDIPFDPKSIKYPFSRERFIKVSLITVKMQKKTVVCKMIRSWNTNLIPIYYIIPIRNKN